jgi:carbon storage regulator
MLVLSRRVGEAICIGNNVVVTVTAIQGGRVLVGIEAPKDIRVDRAEVRERMATEGARRPVGLRLARSDGRGAEASTPGPVGKVA